MSKPRGRPKAPWRTVMRCPGMSERSISNHLRAIGVFRELQRTDPELAKEFDGGPDVYNRPTVLAAAAPLTCTAFPALSRASP